MTEDLKTKKALILETAREIKVQQWTPAEIDQLRRRLLAEHGEAGKTTQRSAASRKAISRILQNSLTRSMWLKKSTAYGSLSASAGKTADFFGWLEVRKQAPDFREKFPQAESEE